MEEGFRSRSQTSPSILAGSKSRLDGRPDIRCLACHTLVVENITYRATLAVATRRWTDATAQLRRAWGRNDAQDDEK